MNKHQLYLSTIDPHAASVAQKYGLGLEVAEYCTAQNMDEQFPAIHEKVQKTVKNCEKLVFHGPFNELFPCAIDPKVRALAAQRYRQAAVLAKNYGAQKLVIHGGYHPYVYYPQWYVEQSIEFWKAFLQEDPGLQIVLENVLEKEPQWLLDIVKAVDDPRLRLCMDVGHVNAYSPIPVMEWLKLWSPYLSHFHIHNNDGSWDTHSSLDQGTIPMEQLLDAAQTLCPEATFTLELVESEPSVRWLLER